jgi:hypothetical protein
MAYDAVILSAAKNPGDCNEGTALATSGICEDAWKLLDHIQVLQLNRIGLQHSLQIRWEEE